MIYVISNIWYPETERLYPESNDLLVFLNRAVSVDYYKEHNKKLVIRRSPDESYGSDIPGVDSWFIFDGPKDRTIPKKIAEDLNKNYDFSYEIASGQVKSPTTGYMAIKYLEYAFPGEGITLVNFGYDINKSSYRCPWHNWRFEAKVLEKYKHIYTVKRMKYDPIEIVYGCDQNRLEQLYLSSESILRHNPNAHVTVMSPTKLELHPEITNVVVDMSKFKLAINSRLSKAAYLRLFVPDILNTLDKAIYLDTDTLCRGCLNDLWRTPVDYIGACHSHDAGRSQAQKLGLNVYHLSGVLLMNLKGLRAIDFTKIALFAAQHFLLPREIKAYLDEGILNVCFNDYIKTIPTTWNYCVNRSYKSYDEPNINNNTACILHYPGGQMEAMRRDAAKNL